MFLPLQLLSLFYVAFSSILPQTVKELDVTKYLGHWSQIYGSPTNVIFQGYGECITADYGLLDNGYISVVNTQINSHDEVENINGYAYYKNVSQPGKLTVHLDGVPVDTPYWVVQLGEVVNKQYQYSIVTTASGISLWVLVRDVERFYKLYDTEVRAFLEEHKYKYVSIVQDECFSLYEQNKVPILKRLRGFIVNN